MKKFDIKQNVKAFLLKEDGKITKKSVLKAGILLGAISIGAKSSEGKWYPCHEVHEQFGECDGEAATYPERVRPAVDRHANAIHDNMLNVKNVFGKLLLGHDNCVESHANHWNYCHTSHDSSNGGW